MNVDFPALNASLNAAAGVLIVAGYLCIRRHLVRAHAACTGAVTLAHVDLSRDRCSPKTMMCMATDCGWRTAQLPWA